MPMRFADVDGTTIDVYQAATQMTDESAQTYPFTSDTLFDRALGPLGYYGVFTANMHTDLPTEQPSDASVASAMARGIPVVSAKQMLDWLDGRNGSSFGALGFDGTSLTFTIAAAAGSNGLTAMVPASARGGALIGIARNGSAIAFTTQVIKGVTYAFFDGISGNYAATYAVDVTPPSISGVTATPGERQYRDGDVDHRRAVRLARRVRPVGLRADAAGDRRAVDDDALGGVDLADAADHLLLPRDLDRRRRQHRYVGDRILHDAGGAVLRHRHHRGGFRRRNR